MAADLLRSAQDREYDYILGTYVFRSPTVLLS